MAWIAFDDRRVGIDGLIGALVLFGFVMTTLVRFLVAHECRRNEQDEEQTRNTKNNSQMANIDVRSVEWPR